MRLELLELRAPASPMPSTNGFIATIVVSGVSPPNRL
jgi:hypothetical protein